MNFLRPLGSVLRPVLPEALRRSSLVTSSSSNLFTDVLKGRTLHSQSFSPPDGKSSLSDQSLKAKRDRIIKVARELDEGRRRPGRGLPLPPPTFHLDGEELPVCPTPGEPDPRYVEQTLRGQVDEELAAEQIAANEKALPYGSKTLPPLDRNVKLKDGTEAHLESYRCKDENELDKFIDGLSGRQAYLTGGCGERDMRYDDNYIRQNIKKHFMSGGYNIAVRAVVDGKRQIVGMGALSFEAARDGVHAVASKMGVISKFQHKGVAVAIKEAQIDYAEMAGASTLSITPTHMSQSTHGRDNMLGVYAKAAQNKGRDYSEHTIYLRPDLAKRSGE